MTGRITRSLLLTLVLWLLLLPSFSRTAQAQPQHEPSALPKPSVFLALERQTIRENDPLPLVIWFSNESAHALTEVKLHIAAPDFLRWHDGGCDGPEIERPLALGSVDAYSSASPRRLCADIGSHSRVGDVNVW